MRRILLRRNDLAFDAEEAEHVLRSRCRARPGGGWVVEVPVLGTEPAPAFVLPDRATRDAYIARAARLGRFRIMSEFVLGLLLCAVSIWFNLAVILGAEDGAALWGAAALSVLALAALRHVEVKRGAGALRAWLTREGMEAPPASERTEEGREAGRWSGWRTELRRCRPGWMVLVDAHASCAFIASFVLFSLGNRPHCRNALWARWGADARLWPLPDGCFNLGTAVLLFMAAWLAVRAAAAYRDWWRCNGRAT